MGSMYCENPEGDMNVAIIETEPIIEPTLDIHTQPCVRYLKACLISEIFEYALFSYIFFDIVILLLAVVRVVYYHEVTHHRYRRMLSLVIFECVTLVLFVIAVCIILNGMILIHNVPLYIIPLVVIPLLIKCCIIYNGVKVYRLESTKYMFLEP
jgi:hypothetical protein